MAKWRRKGGYTKQMADLPRSTKHSKVGSNLKAKARKALVATDEALQERRNKPFLLAERKFLRDRRAILTKPVVKPAVGIFQENSDAYAKAFLRANGDGVAIGNAGRRARRSIDIALRERIRGYRKYETLRQRYVDQYRALIDARRATSTIGGLQIVPGDVLLPVDIAFQVFRPPFGLFDVVPPRANGSVVPPSSSGSADNSFAQPGSGIVVTNVQFHTEDTLRFFEEGYNPTRHGLFHSAVGIDYQVPQTGFLFGSAVIQNLFNKFTMSVQDKFGFSSANVHMDHTIFVRIIRSGEVTPFERLVFGNGIQSFGDDFSFSTSPIQNSTPFRLNFETRDAFLKGERIQILVGASLATQTHLDDMKSFMAALTMWQVKRLSIGIRV
jgi:hypothetical protein